MSVMKKYSKLQQWLNEYTSKEQGSHWQGKAADPVMQNMSAETDLVHHLCTTGWFTQLSGLQDFLSVKWR